MSKNLLFFRHFRVFLGGTRFIAWKEGKSWNELWRVQPNGRNGNSDLIVHWVSIEEEGRSLCLPNMFGIIISSTRKKFLGYHRRIFNLFFLLTNSSFLLIYLDVPTCFSIHNLFNKHWTTCSALEVEHLKSYMSFLCSPLSLLDCNQR